MKSCSLVFFKALTDIQKFSNWDIFRTSEYLSYYETFKCRESFRFTPNWSKRKLAAEKRQKNMLPSLAMSSVLKLDWIIGCLFREQFFVVWFPAKLFFAIKVSLWRFYIPKFPYCDAFGDLLLPMQYR
jgi:hypothetical protein